MVYSYADHLDAHPEIATEENLKAAQELQAKGWYKTENQQALVRLANQLKVPNNERRNSQRQLAKFLDLLLQPLKYAVIIRKKGIKPGTVVNGAVVVRIGRDRRLYFENGEMIVPAELLSIEQV